MTIKGKLINALGMMFLAIFMLASCSDTTENQDPMEEEEVTDKGRLNVQLTDSPVDDPNVKAVFVTFVGIELDGHSHLLENPKTIEISALNNGKVETLIDQDIEAKSYNSMSLLLDYSSDASGQNPGCYVVTEDNIVHNLNPEGASSAKIKLDGINLMIEKDNTYEPIIDFDLRKSIVYTDENTDQFDFHTNLDGAMRIVKGNSFAITGSVKDQLGISDDKMVVYAYQRGAFDIDAETTGTVKFQNAISSSAVDAEGNFSIHFLEEGEYDLKIANYKMDDEGKIQLEAMLEVDVLSGLNLGIITLDSNVSTELTVLTKIEV